MILFAVYENSVVCFTVALDGSGKRACYGEVVLAIGNANRHNVNSTVLCYVSKGMIGAQGSIAIGTICPMAEVTVGIRLYAESEGTVEANLNGMS